jgi:hypothetical protein
LNCLKSVLDSKKSKQSKEANQIISHLKTVIGPENLKDFYTKIMIAPTKADYEMEKNQKTLEFILKQSSMDNLLNETKSSEKRGFKSFMKQQKTHFN